MISSNLTLFLSECLRKMCIEMIAIQQELNSAYHDSIHLRKNIIRICRDHFALTNEFNNVSLNVLDLINSLHTSVMNYEVVQKSSNQQTDYSQQNLDYLQQSKSDNQYFIDRQYRRDEPSYDRRSDYRRDEDEFRDKSNDKFQNCRFKKCFVCSKSEC